MRLTDEDAFYLVCVTFFVAGVLIACIGGLVARWSEKAGGTIAMFGLACGGTAVLMALIGPRS